MVERTTPGSLALITTPQLVRYVLELQAGEAHALGLATGDRAALPVPADAASGESR
jgi:uncharacterized membrane protein (UPF0127 family)